MFKILAALFMLICRQTSGTSESSERYRNSSKSWSGTKDKSVFPIISKYKIQSREAPERISQASMHVLAP